MNTSLLSPFRAFPAWVLLVVAVAGCRTYGSYNSEALTLEQIVQANHIFAEDLERARSDLAMLEQAGVANPSLDTVATAYAAVVLQQEMLLALHQAMAEKAADSDDHRLLHRTYGAIITDHQLIRDRYAHVLAALQGMQEPDTLQVLAMPPLLSSYQVKPAFYQRIEHALNQPVLRDLTARTSPSVADTTITAVPD